MNKIEKEKSIIKINLLGKDIDFDIMSVDIEVLLDIEQLAIDMQEGVFNINTARKVKSLLVNLVDDDIICDLISKQNLTIGFVDFATKYIGFIGEQVKKHAEFSRTTELTTR